MEMVPTIVDVIAAGQLTISNTEDQLNSGCTIGLLPVDDVVDRFSLQCLEMSPPSPFLYRTSSVLSRPQAFTIDRDFKLNIL